MIEDLKPCSYGPIALSSESMHNHDLTILIKGLPTEIAARRRQYERYRDHLLSFREAV